MTEYIKINDEPIEIEYVEDEHEEARDFEPSFWLAAAGYNRRYYLGDFVRTHDNPWIGGEFPENIHGFESDEYWNPLFVEILDGGEAVNVYRQA